MRLNHKNCNNHMPTFMELQMMLKKLKLSQIKDNLSSQRTTQNEIPSGYQMEKQTEVHLNQESSIIFDNFQDPNCFEEEIKAIDIGKLNRTIEKKPMIKQGNQADELIQKFKLYINREPVDHLNKSREEVKKADFKRLEINNTQKLLKKSASTLTINKQSQNQNKQNKKTQLNRQKKQLNQAQQRGKRKVFSKIQMHKFSDCQQLLRETHKK